MHKKRCFFPPKVIHFSFHKMYSSSMHSITGFGFTWSHLFGLERLSTWQPGSQKDGITTELCSLIPLTVATVFVFQELKNTAVVVLLLKVGTKQDIKDYQVDLLEALRILLADQPVKVKPIYLGYFKISLLLLV